MPIHSGTDKDGSFYQWGSTGKKYHFNPDDKKSRQNALCKAKAQQTAIYSSGWKGDNNMADKMKLIKVKTGDAKPSMRVKAAGNVFVEIYKDNKGFFYKIDVPGQTGYESKERFQDQNKALNSGTAHAKRFIATIKSKVGDDEVSASRRYVQQMSNNLGSVSRNAAFILGQMQSWPNKNDRMDIGFSLQHLAETAQDTAATLLKIAKQLMK